MWDAALHIIQPSHNLYNMYNETNKRAHIGNNGHPTRAILLWFVALLLYMDFTSHSLHIIPIRIK